MTWLLLAFRLAFYAILQLPLFVHLFACLSFCLSFCPSSCHPSVRPFSHASITKVDFQAIVIQEFSIVNSMVLRDCFNILLFILSCLSEVGFEWSDTQRCRWTCELFFFKCFLPYFCFASWAGAKRQFLVITKKRIQIAFCSTRAW